MNNYYEKFYINNPEGKEYIIFQNKNYYITVNRNNYSTGWIIGEFRGIEPIGDNWIQYSDKRLAFDNPYRIPVYIKDHLYRKLYVLQNDSYVLKDHVGSFLYPKYGDFIKHIISVYGHLLPIGLFSFKHFSNFLKTSYSLDNPVNKLTYDYLRSI